MDTSGRARLKRIVCFSRGFKGFYQKPVAFAGFLHQI
jgi:hypothetical protein